MSKSNGRYRTRWEKHGFSYAQSRAKAVLRLRSLIEAIQEEKEKAMRVGKQQPIETSLIRIGALADSMKIILDSAIESDEEMFFEGQKRLRSVTLR